MAGPPRNPPDQRVLIIGSTSYVGRCLTEYANRNGALVTAVSSTHCNLLDTASACAFFGALDRGTAYDLVLLSVVNKDVANDYASYLDNVRMARNFMQAVSGAGARIKSVTYVSSVDVYGRRPALPLTENSQIAPDTWYGLAKYCCEWMLKTSGEIPCPTTVLRIPGIYGRGHRDRSVIGRFVRSMQDSRRVAISGSGQTLRDYTYVEDLCRLILQVIALRPGAIVNVASGASRAVVEIAKLVGAVLGQEFEIVPGEEDTERDFDLVFDNQGLRTLLPDFRFTELRRGIESYL